MCFLLRAMASIETLGMILCMERKCTKECTECKGMETSHSKGQTFGKTVDVHKTSCMNTLLLCDETGILLPAEPGEIAVSSSKKISFISSLTEGRL